MKKSQYTPDLLGALKGLCADMLKRGVEHGEDTTAWDAAQDAIAAAPETAAECDRLKEVNAELLEALNLLIISSNIRHVALTTNYRSLSSAIREARAAIAKAEVI